jgi:hypothetical protein
MANDKQTFPRPRQSRLAKAGRALTLETRVIGRGLKSLEKLHGNTTREMADYETLRLWVSKIREPWQQAAESIIETGQMLLRARDALKLQPKV